MAKASADRPVMHEYEAGRLAVLASYDMLDSDAEEDFDAIARTASLVCETPVALVSLVDEHRQWFKSRVGTEWHETPRAQSFCAHAIEAGHLMEVPDASRDERFADNPLVTGEPHIRFYAGVPLEVEEGYRLGTLCVIDHEPRQLSDRQHLILEELARVAVRLMEQRRSRRLAQAREALLDSLLEALPEGIVACDSLGQLTLFNSLARAWHGTDPMQLPANEWSRHFDLYASDGRTPLATEHVPLHRAWVGEIVRDQEICILAKGQLPRIVACNGQAYTDTEGRSVGAVVAMRDITESRRTECEAAAARAHLQAVIDASTEVAIIATDSDGTITLFNAGAERLLGYSAAEAIGTLNPMVFHDAEEVEARRQALVEALGQDVQGFDIFRLLPSQGHTESHVWTFVCKDGTRRRCHLVISAMRNEQAECIGLVGIATDLSRLHAMETALRRSEAQFRAAFDTAPLGMALVSLEGRFIEVNRTLCAMWGYEREALLAIDFQALTHPDDLASDLSLVGNLLQGKIESYNLTKRYYTRGGRLFWGLLSVALVRDDDGRPQYFVAQIQDVTEQRQLERLKNDFVAMVSHELRTPLTSVNGSLSLINAGVLGDVPPQFREMLDVAQRNTERLGHLVNDLLDWEKLAAEKLAFDMQRFSLTALLKEAIDSNRGLADTANVALALEGQAACLVEVDSLRFAQVMANLLSNAVKFSPRGGTVHIRHAVNDGEALIEVLDNGPGVPDEFRSRIFQHFAQADAGNTRSRGGTGLGLAITKQLIEHMHGSIGFESVAGEGATFWLRLPCSECE